MGAIKPGGGGGGASVAAADITDAGATGIALVQSATEAAAGLVLRPWQSISLASSSGWSDSTVGGSSTVTGWSGSVVLTTGASGGDAAITGRALPGDALAVEIVARISATTASTSDHIVSVGVGDAVALTRTASLYATVYGSGTVQVGTGGTTLAAVSVASILGGQGWLRLVVLGGTARVYAGVGSSSALPTSWTDVGYVDRGNTTPWAKLFLQAYTVSGAFAATIGDLRWRAL